MVNYELGVEVKRDRVVTRVLENTQDTRQALEDVAQAIRDRQADVFRSGNNGRWAPNAPDTVRAKGSSRPLIKNGGLLDSLTRKGARGSRTVITLDRILVGSDLVGGLMADKGARGAPRRDPVPDVTHRELQGWAQILADDLTRVTS